MLGGVVDLLGAVVWCRCQLKMVLFQRWKCRCCCCDQLLVAVERVGSQSDKSNVECRQSYAHQQIKVPMLEKLSNVECWRWLFARVLKGCSNEYGLITVAAGGTRIHTTGDQHATHNSTVVKQQNNKQLSGNSNYPPQ